MPKPHVETVNSAQINVPNKRSAETMTLGEVYRDYESFLIGEGKRPKTRSYYLWALRNLAVWLGGEPVVADVNPINVRRYLMQYQATHRPRSVRTLKAAVSHFAKFAIQSEWMLVDPTGGIRMPRLDEPFRPMPEREQVIDVFAACELMPDPYRGAVGCAAVAIMAYTGIRISDLLNIRLSDLNLEKRTIFLRDSKGGKQYTAYASTECMDAVRAYLRVRPEKCDHDYLFARSKQTPVRYSMMRAILAELASIAGYRNDKALLPHALRRANITHSLEAGADLKALSANVGHSSTQVTMDVYNQTNEAKRRAAAEKAGQIYKPTSQKPAEPSEEERKQIAKETRYKRHIQRLK